MSQKAILYDSNRCTACQACVLACKEKHGAALVQTSDNAPADDGYQRSADLDADTLLMVTLAERMSTSGAAAWEIGRRSCVHCADALCAQVCPTGALSVDERTGFVVANDGRCVACHLCELVCPLDVPRFDGEAGRIRKCDGCNDDVAADGTPACVSACPFAALAFGTCEELVPIADAHVDDLHERGYEQASVLGVDEQGGTRIVQVLKYGVKGSALEALTSASADAWMGVAEAAGPVSVGVLAAGGIGATVAFARETRKWQKAKSEERTASASATVGAQAAGMLQDEAVGQDGRPNAGELYSLGESLDGQATDTREHADGRAPKETPLEAALRKRAAIQGGATPAASAAAAAVASGTEQHLYPVEFDDSSDGYDDGDELDGIEPEDADEPESTVWADDAAEQGSGEFAGAAEQDGTDAGAAEADGVDDTEDTGELYNLEEFQRLLAEDQREYELAHGGAQAPAESADELAEPEDPAASSEDLAAGPAEP